MTPAGTRTITEANDRAGIHAVFTAPEVEGMEELYAAIGSRLQAGDDFEAAYADVIAKGGSEATTWIRFCVPSATRFVEPPVEVNFLAALEHFSRQHVGL